MSDSKFKRVLAAREAEETNALLSLRRVEDVVEQRRKNLERVEGSLKKIEARINTLLLDERREALRSGDMNLLSSINRYVTRLRVKQQGLNGERDKLCAEFQRAEHRAVLANDELVEARVDKKKVEHLLTSREQERKIQNAAREELLSDELSKRWSKK